MPKERSLFLSGIGLVYQTGILSSSAVLTGVCEKVLHGGEKCAILYKKKCCHRSVKTMKHIQTIAVPCMKKGEGTGCGNCQASCQSACKTSCTVANQSCQNKK